MKLPEMKQLIRKTYTLHTANQQVPQNHLLYNCNPSEIVSSHPSATIPASKEILDFCLSRRPCQIQGWNEKPPQETANPTSV